MLSGRRKKDYEAEQAADSLVAQAERARRRATHRAGPGGSARPIDAWCDEDEEGDAEADETGAA